MLTEEETKIQIWKISLNAYSRNKLFTFGMEAVLRNSSVLLNFIPEKSSYIRQPINENGEVSDLKKNS